MTNEEERPLIAGDSEESRRTVLSLLAEETSSDDDIEKGMVFLRRLWALLLLQYGTILFFASPFGLIESFRDAVEPYHGVMEAISIVGIVLSIGLAITRGQLYPYAHVALVSLTIFVALELGLTFARASWGKCGLIAIGQATTSFGIILALLQFDSRSLIWLTYPTAALLCLFLSGIWTIVQAETGVSWTVAAAISLGGWGFALLTLLCCYQITKHIAPDEYVLATLFILVPEALLCLQRKKRSVAS